MRSAAPTAANPSKINQEVLILMDDASWVWDFTKLALTSMQLPFAKVPSSLPLRHSWNRFHKTPIMIVHWEGKSRSGGAILEEILDISPEFDINDRIIVITTNPVHEDVVHFAELGVTRVIRPRLREKDLEHAAEEIARHIQQMTNPSRTYPKEDVWLKLAIAIDNAPNNPPAGFTKKISAAIKKLQDPGKTPTPREIDVVAGFHIKTGELKLAENLLVRSLEQHPNHFRGWNRLIDVKLRLGEHLSAYELLQKMQLQNRGSVRRLAAMGEVQLAMNDHRKAEPFFRSALDRDPWCAKALNGLAEVMFAKNDLDETRQLLSKSSLAYKFAVKLNAHGIELSKQGRFQEALEHYSKAQYVLPQQEKSPRLFFNIALCYKKWGLPAMAREFLELALIKEPKYDKARKALNELESVSSKGDHLDDLDAA